MYEKESLTSSRDRTLPVLLVVLGILVVSLFMTQARAASSSEGAPPSPSVQSTGPTAQPEGDEIPDGVRELTLEEDWVDTRRGTLEG